MATFRREWHFRLTEERGWELLFARVAPVRVVKSASNLVGSIFGESERRRRVKEMESNQFYIFRLHYLLLMS